jgi:O-antigen/teichoic acid export membrane protein
MIDSKQATEALSEINEIARRVRQSTTYQLSSLLIIMWGVLVFAGNLVTWLSPGNAGYAWIAVYVAGIAGSFAVSAYGHVRTGIRAFDIRWLGQRFLVSNHIMRRRRVCMTKCG